jgi:serine/threonine protein kinase
MTTVEENMFVAVQALRLGMLEHSQFVAACEDWAKDKSAPLIEVLEAKGHIDGAQRGELETLVKSQLRQGDARKALAAAADLDVRDRLREIEDRDIQRSLADLPPARGIRILPPESETETTAGRYRLTREYSEGGLSRIWLARDANLHRDVILKELHPDLADLEETRQRFLNEAQITGQLEHPNIVPVYELGPRGEDQRPFYTMRFVRGETLQDAIKRYHKGQADALEHRRLLGIFVSVCNAIAYAHSRGVLHRDLKPQNVVVGSFGEVILLDWGLAKVAGVKEATTGGGVTIPDAHDPQMTAEGSVLGTPAYLAPEQAGGRVDEVSERTDVYGLGAILFEILTGRPPHVGASAAEVVGRVLKEPTPEARDVNPSAPPQLGAICAKAMEKEPTERYASAAALADDIHRFLGDLPVSAYPEPLPARARRWMRRHRYTTLAGLLFFVAIVAGLANLYWQRTRAIEQEIETLGQESRQESGRLHALIDVLRNDVAYLGSHWAIPRILAGEGEEPGANDTAKARLASGLMEFLRHRPNYFRARLLGKEGMEIVRVERDRFGDAPPQRVTTLHSGDSAHFRETLPLPRSRVNLSRVELNRDGDQIEWPEVPVIRAAVPVFASRDEGAAGEADGVLVIHIDCTPLFEMLQGRRDEASSDAAVGKSTFVCVTNNDGYFLWNPEQPERTFGFERSEAEQGESAYRLQTAWPHPDLAAFFAPGSATRKVSAIAGQGAGRRAIFVYRLGLDGGATRFLGLAVVAPYAELADRAEASYRDLSIATFVLIGAFAFVLVGAFIASRRRDQRLAATGMAGDYIADRTTTARTGR